MHLRSLFTALVSALLLLLAAPAHADSGIEIATVRAVLSPDGSLRVTSTYEGIAVESIEQTIAKRAPLGDLRTLHYTIDDVAASIDEKPVSPSVSERNDSIAVTVDMNDAKSVTISYTVRGAVRTDENQPDNRLVKWPIVQGLNAQVGTVDGSIELLDSPPDFDCQAGTAEELHNCALWHIDHQNIGTPTFQDGPLAAGEQLIVSASQPASVVADSSQIEMRWTLDRAFSVTPVTGAVSMLILGAGAVALAIWHRKAGRDLAPGGAVTPIAEFHPIGPGIAEFRVLADVRPGQVGTVADEIVDPIDITATILDLAVRGYLRITKIDAPSTTDWIITRRTKDASKLHHYEQCLLDAFDTPDGILVSLIHETIGPKVGELQHHLYNDVVANGWFAKRPDSVRTDSRNVGAALIGIGLLATALLAWLTTWGLVGLSIVAIGIASLFVAREMPRRSREGAALLAGLHGFSAILAQQRTDMFAPGEELAQISQVLPYAIVLGGKDRWIAAMVASDDDDTPDGTDLDWFHGPDDWHLQDLPRCLDALIASIQGHLFGR